MSEDGKSFKCYVVIPTIDGSVQRMIPGIMVELFDNVNESNEAVKKANVNKRFDNMVYRVFEGSFTEYKEGLKW